MFQLPHDYKWFQGWKLWLKVSVFRHTTNGKVDQYQLLPYPKFDPNNIPIKELKNQLKPIWRTIYSIMEETQGLFIPSNKNYITQTHF